MPIKRGDDVLAFIENVGSPRGSAGLRWVVQTDHNNARLNETIIAAITSNVSHVHEPHQLLIDISTPDGRASGLLQNSAVRCERLHVVLQTDLVRTIGHLPAEREASVDIRLPDTR